MQDHSSTKIKLILEYTILAKKKKIKIIYRLAVDYEGG